ncbi:sugar ABC transporter permease [uncultured Roseobacter sp.]|uniref:carbohydrate ABC transporter permease n=1 Tax=uncultured Roseobacter sp. TaxID=114847 RepID=UPI0026309392|nr:sugar ABC transporter permease [uncultured Roseobacter sp.]
MRRSTFFSFVAPSVMSMLILIALPLVAIIYLSLHQSYTQMEIKEVKTEVPLFGGKTREVIRNVPQPVLDDNGNGIQVWEYVGAQNLKNAIDTEGLSAAFKADQELETPRSFIKALFDEVRDVDFWSALEFTLIYTFLTTPIIIILGFGLALATNRLTERLRGPVVFVTLLPMIVTPVVSSLAVYWLFVDGGVIAASLEAMGIGKFYFLADQFTIRAVIVAYGVWYAAPFAFIILYAGLQTVPDDPIEAAIIDGASPWQRVRYIVIPHLSPLFAVIALIHIMDSYRVFEPILVFGSRVFANSVQYLTYYTLVFEDNIHKAAAYAILTVLGVIVLLIPIMIKTFKDQKAGK